MDAPAVDVTIRPAEAADEAATVALWRACGLVVSYNDPGADFRFAHAGRASDVLVAVDARGRVVGSVMVGHDGHRGWLYYVAADPGMRSQGIGRRMVKAAEAWLSERGVRKAELMVRQTNAGVMAFYERLGFERSAVLVMQRWLTGD
ncbi:GNAT family acetyltransferase [Shumkonia mesophila]|uniref:GNAT family acetyltransferase n=1 Tax=Shumkonia mesophila TaxID=2838854 RepID=UPI0029341910|nr:GNAT family acetyltransferase [Shumkonia mesophila]